MADVRKRGAAAPEESMGGLMAPPKPGQALFGGDVKTIQIVDSVHMTQLLDEIEEHLGDRQRYQVAMEVSNHRSPVSATNPLLVHVHPGTADMDAVLGVVNRHTPNPDYGKSDKDLELEKLKARLAKGDLALPELNKILRSLV